MILHVDQATSPQSLLTVRTIFLDRDGVINRKAPEGEYVADWDHFHPLPGVAQAIARLNPGRQIFVVTNQRGVALGLYTCAQVEALHARVQAWLAQSGARIDGFYYCPHDSNACTCRKPLPGLIEQAIADHPGIDPATSVLIGDSLSDIQAARHAGLRAIFIEGEPDRRKPGAEEAAALADYTVGSLAQAAALLHEG